MLNLISEIHNRGMKFVLATTGGGTKAISELTACAGASKSVLEHIVPYSRQSMIDFLGYTPENYCSAEIARAMAMASFRRAIKYGGTHGFGCTCSIATEKPKQGNHRFYIATQSESRSACISFVLEKGKRSRAEEEDVVASKIIDMIATEAGIQPTLIKARPSLLTKEEDDNRIIQTCFDPDLAWSDLLMNRIDHWSPNWKPDSKGVVLFPGSFNPLHDGHQKMKEVAEKILDKPVVYEISIFNVDKRPLDFIDMKERFKQFGDNKVVLTTAKHFVEKSRYVPNATFVVGIDTLMRICEPKYYENWGDGVANAVEDLSWLNINFLVFGRVKDGKFYSVKDLTWKDVHSHLLERCQAVPEDMFRIDISSTQLRKE